MNRILPYSLIACMLAAGCSHPLHINSAYNPDYNGRKYAKILVVATDGRGTQFQKQIERRVALFLKERAPELTFVAAHDKVKPPFTRNRLDDVIKAENLEARLVIVSTRPQFKGADQTVEEIAQGIPGRPEEMLGVEATLINAASGHRLWMALVSFPVKDDNIADGFDFLARVVAAKVLASNVLAVE